MEWRGMKSERLETAGGIELEQRPMRRRGILFCLHAHSDSRGEVHVVNDGDHATKPLLTASLRVLYTVPPGATHKEYVKPSRSP